MPRGTLGRTNASLPKGEKVDTVTMETALALLAARAAKGGGGSRRGTARGRKRTGPGEA
ncbi:MAG: hypothetical protein OXI22_10295 [Defluviicoccus sp.]|nr:hypothetical protein [Defluviicoccus sp.]MDE0384265.1 hypothetical protein [Defluviicoccus sp.]